MHRAQGPVRSDHRRPLRRRQQRDRLTQAERRAGRRAQRHTGNDAQLGEAEPQYFITIIIVIVVAVLNLTRALAPAPRGVHGLFSQPALQQGGVCAPPPLDDGTRPDRRHRLRHGGVRAVRARLRERGMGGMFKNQAHGCRAIRSRNHQHCQTDWVKKQLVGR
eukprot:472924-Pleurochrysis_carterae.AAC.1